MSSVSVRVWPSRVEISLTVGHTFFVSSDTLENKSFDLFLCACA